MGHGLSFELPPGTDGRELVRRVADLWRDRGYEDVELALLHTPFPTVNAVPDGFKLAFNVVEEKNRASLRGSTPCLRREEG